MASDDGAGAVGQALILDFGGVISRTLFETHDLTERSLSLPPGTLQWRGPFDVEHDPLWRDMQADRITERDYWMMAPEAKDYGVIDGVLTRRELAAVASSSD